MSYIALATRTLTSSAASVTFSSIPTSVNGVSLRDLVLVINGGVDSGAINVLVSFNGDTAANYSAVQMSGTGSAADGSGVSGRLLNYFGYMEANLNTVIKTEIFDFAQTDKHKTYLTRANNAGNGVAALASRWANTSAINTVALSLSGSTFRIGTTFSLYGVA
jgi:hypothetical protein